MTADEVLAHQREQHQQRSADLLRELLADTPPDYGGAFDGIGTVYSDADPGL